MPDHIIEFQNKSKKTIEKIESLTKLKKMDPSKEKVFNAVNTKRGSMRLRRQDLQKSRHSSVLG